MSSTHDLKIFALTENPNTHVLFTPWSTAHIMGGVTAKSLGINFWMFSAMHAIYETNDYLQNARTDDGRIINSFENSVADQVIAMVGHLLPLKKRAIYPWLLLLNLGILLGVNKHYWG